MKRFIIDGLCYAVSVFVGVVLLSAYFDVLFL